MLIDKATITVRAGAGGDGCMSFRREKFIPKGGPNGGDGGRGGNVYLRSNSRMRTLLDFVRKPKFDAGRGKDGSGYNKFGEDGQDLILEVPVGTTVYYHDQVLIDFVEPDQQLLVAKGGRGGRGNVHFKNSVRQAPRIAEKGEPPEQKELRLQLRIIADVGLIGMPNAGKSTLLSRLTRANPKIANYPFTTLSPNLGVAFYHDREIVFADIPGLIEGSHTGRGLGHEFLQHIERTRLLVHVVDPLGYDKTPKENIRIINEELKNYSKDLSKKPQILAINKQDLTGAEKIFTEIKRSYKKTPVFAVSGVTGDGIKELLAEVVKKLDTMPMTTPKLADAKPVHIHLEPEFWVEREGETYFVKGKKVEKLVAMTNFRYPEAVERTQHILKKIGVERALAAKGAQPGDQVDIAGFEFMFEPTLEIGDPRLRENYESKRRPRR